MGAFDFLFKKPKEKKQVEGFFQLLNGYTPIFTTHDGGVYEMETVRACIHAFANHCSKLQPNVQGADQRGIKAMLDSKPNPFMTSAQFVYKVATIYEAQNTCFIVPLLDKLDRLCGYYPVNPQQTEVVKVKGSEVPYLRFTFKDGKKMAIELSRCGVVSKYLYNNDIMGESNHALQATLQLIHTQNEGIVEGIKNSASIRFMAKVNNFADPDDVAHTRKEWVKNNLGPDAGGLALFDSYFDNVQQIQSTAKIVDAEQMEIIQTRVLNYFGCNEEVLQNKTVGDAWSAYYEGKIEPFAVQLSQAMTMMTFNQNERTRQNAIVWSSNRLQYMGNAEKLQTSTQLFDRGILTTNDVMDIWNLPHVPEGDKRYIRTEYTEISQLDQVTKLQEELASAQAALNASKAPEPDPADTEEEENDDPQRENQD
ncbi:MAG: phage portal protein [Clostridia bacterium]|nr:phage portal protein [Clostridia bacterium]